jgi:hypothetical protein
MLPNLLDICVVLFQSGDLDDLDFTYSCGIFNMFAAFRLTAILGWWPVREISPPALSAIFTNFSVVTEEKGGI